MKIVAYLDNDKLHQLDVRHATLFAVEPKNAVSQQQLVTQYPKVFREAVG